MTGLDSQRLNSFFFLQKTIKKYICPEYGQLPLPNQWTEQQSISSTLASFQGSTPVHAVSLLSIYDVFEDVGEATGEGST